MSQLEEAVGEIWKTVKPYSIAWFAAHEASTGWIAILIVSAYHADAIDDHGKFMGGPEAFADWVIDMHRANHLTHQHCLFNHSCEVQGITAHTETYYMFVAINLEGPPLATSGGRYVDRLERRNGRWAIAHRLCIRDWAAMDERPPDGDLTAFTATRNTLPPSVRRFMNTGARPSRDHSDPSYWRPLVVDTERLNAWGDVQSALTSGDDGGAMSWILGDRLWRQASTVASG